MALDPVDVCVIGSGAGGGPVAWSLARAGIRVVLLEKGRYYKKEDFVHDEILASRRSFFTPLPWDEPHLLRKGAAEKYQRTNEGWTANCVGGGTTHMSGFFYRLKPVDFRLRSELGPVEGANLADWPLTYGELAPWYDVAEAELGVSGNAVKHPFAEPRSRPYPLPPLREHPIAAQVDAACKALGYHSIPTARGIISDAYRGRAACGYCNLCGSYGCEVDAKSSTRAALIPAALETGKLDLRPGCMATQILAGPDGRAKSVVYLDENGHAQEQPAKIVVVSCTAIESARLLLNSRSPRFPNGLANGNGLVGRNLVFSSFGQSRAVFKISTQAAARPWLQEPEQPAPFVDRSVQDFYLLPKDTPHGFRKGGTLGFMWAHANPIYAALHLAGTGPKGIFGKPLKDKLREYRDSKILEFEIYAEFLPTDGTYVTVEPAAVDKFGLPVAAITIQRHPLDLVATRYLVERGEEILRRLEPDKVERVGEQGQTLLLQGGTCRFGEDPATSVLDKNCRAHEVDNLYVVDGSFMPTSGGVPITLTIAANAFRVGRHLVGRIKQRG